MFSDKKKISIDKQLYERLSEAAAKAGYATVDEMAAHILEREACSGADGDDQQQAENQLRGLGYIE